MLQAALPGDKRLRRGQAGYSLCWNQSLSRVSRCSAKYLPAWEVQGLWVLVGSWRRTGAAQSCHSLAMPRACPEYPTVAPHARSCLTWSRKAKKKKSARWTWLAAIPQRTVTPQPGRHVQPHTASVPPQNDGDSTSHCQNPGLGSNDEPISLSRIITFPPPHTGDTEAESKRVT